MEETTFLPNTDELYEASRFLAQATFGADHATIYALSGQDYAEWIDDQRTKPVSQTREYMNEIWQQMQHCWTSGNCDQSQFPFRYWPMGGQKFHPRAENVVTAWMRNILFNGDQLRQRIAWSLSQIFVVSTEGVGGYMGFAHSDYYDMLTTHALGNFRDLLLDVSMNNVMAWYLSSLGNQKADPSINRYPDENYAREIMQLFSVGLWELNLDGTRKLDGGGQPIPTYDNDDITEMARVFTGLWFEGLEFKKHDQNNGNLSMLRSLTVFEDQHDQEAKTLFHGKEWESTIPANQGGMVDIEQAVGILFNHPNTPPFICRQLIQFLVKSDPSPAYVERVANAFVDNGDGVRGDLFVVVKTILLDTEARTYNVSDNQTGKLIEPMIRITRLFKAFNAHCPHYHGEPHEFVYWWWPEELAFGQWPLQSPSVFSFFNPNYIDYQSALGQNDPPIESPEFGAFDSLSIPALSNYFFRCIFENMHTAFKLDSSHIDKFDYDSTPIPHFVLDFSNVLALSDDEDALIDYLDLMLCCGQMSLETREIVRSGFNSIAVRNERTLLLRVKTAIYLTVISANSAILR